MNVLIDSVVFGTQDSSFLQVKQYVIPLIEKLLPVLKLIYIVIYNI